MREDRERDRGDRGEHEGPPIGNQVQRWTSAPCADVRDGERKPEKTRAEGALAPSQPQAADGESHRDDQAKCDALRRTKQSVRDRPAKEGPDCGEGADGSKNERSVAPDEGLEVDLLRNPAAQGRFVRNGEWRPRRHRMGCARWPRAVFFGLSRSFDLSRALEPQDFNSERANLSLERGDASLDGLRTLPVASHASSRA